MNLISKITYWPRLLVAAVLAIYLYVLMEWLFFITKPSFASAMGHLERLQLLLITPLPPVALVAVATGLIWLVARMAPNRPGGALLAALAWAPPAMVLASCVFILIDNFTYTLFGFGVVSTSGIWRGAYAVLLLALFGWAYRRLRDLALSAGRALALSATILGATLLLVSAGAALWRLRAGVAMASGAEPGRHPAGHLPSILIVSTDGLSAEDVSVYGYERENTPFIRSVMPRALVFENALPNSSFTSGSITSMLTGKLPIRTRLVFAPDILTGAHAYQHLPGVLRRLGYHSIQAGVRYQVDALDLNLRDGFDVVNAREAHHGVDSLFPRRAILTYPTEVYLLQQVHERLADRIQHVTGIRSMGKPMAELTSPDRKSLSDAERVAAVLDFMDRTEGPVFANVHLMGTHGGLFSPEQRVFSAGKTQAARWDRDFHDDAILDFDAHVARIFSHLRTRNALDDTVIVLTSDHGPRRLGSERIPLLFFFPGGAHHGRVTANAQLLDVAPTLLDYLGVPIPDWMEGQSVIAGELDPLRPILSAGLTGFAAVRMTGPFDDRRAVKRDASPPFFGMDFISASICDRTVRIGLRNGRLYTLPVAGHTAPCRPEDIPPAAEVRERLVRELRRSGYDVSSLEPVTAGP